jgi:homoserine dehydrogenase
VKYSTFKNNATAENNVKFVSDFSSAYYLRLTAEDRAGVLAKITGICGKYGISIVKISQKGERDESGRVSLFIVTHKTAESSVNRAIEKINQTQIAKLESVIRVEQ